MSEKARHEAEQIQTGKFFTLFLCRGMVKELPEHLQERMLRAIEIDENTVHDHVGRLVMTPRCPKCHVALSLTDGTMKCRVHGIWGAERVSDV